MVDLPLAESPVNQTVKPCWPRKLLRSTCVRDGCHVMFLKFFLKMFFFFFFNFKFQISKKKKILCEIVYVFSFFWGEGGGNTGEGVFFFCARRRKWRRRVTGQPGADEGWGRRNLRCCHCFLNYGGGGFLRPGCCGDGHENGGLHGIIRRIVYG